jgi:uncharacterized membrane protein YccC
MSTSPISLSSGTTQTQGQRRGQQIMQDFQQLASSLQSGDLIGAQQAYSSLQQLLGTQSQSSQQTTSSSNNPIAKDFQALGETLQSGSLSSAQGAFSQLQNGLQSASQDGSGTTATITIGVRSPKEALPIPTPARQRRPREQQLPATPLDQPDRSCRFSLRPLGE